MTPQTTLRPAPMDANERRAHWGNLHIQGGRNPPVQFTSERRDFWKPLWVERELERRARNKKDSA